MKRDKKTRWCSNTLKQNWILWGKNKRLKWTKIRERKMLFWCYWPRWFKNRIWNIFFKIIFARHLQSVQLLHFPFCFDLINECVLGSLEATFQFKVEFRFRNNFTRSRSRSTLKDWVANIQPIVQQFVQIQLEKSNCCNKMASAWKYKFDSMRHKQTSQTYKTRTPHWGDWDGDRLSHARFIHLFIQRAIWTRFVCRTNTSQ